MKATHKKKFNPITERTYVGHIMGESRKKNKEKFHDRNRQYQFLLLNKTYIVQVSIGEMAHSINFLLEATQCGNIQFKENYLLSSLLHVKSSWMAVFTCIVN